MITVETYRKWKDIMGASFDRTDKYIRAAASSTDEESKNNSLLDAKVNQMFFDDLKSLFSLLKSKIGEKQLADIAGIVTNV
jgi:hypothetical protein